MIRDTIMQMASQDPAVAQSVDAMEAQLQRSPIVPEDLDEAIKLLEFVLQNPDKYAEMRNAAVKDGLIDEAMFPPEFDEVVIISILIAMYGLQDRLQQRGYSRGGLSVAGRRLQTGGRGGDSMLAHINPREAEVLRRMGGQGTVNPNTGLREYKGLKKILGTVLPIALSVFAPGVGTAISGFLGGALGLGTTSAGILGGALTNAASAKLTGGNVRQAAIMGGLGGGMSNGLGNKVGSTFVPKASAGVQNMIGNAVVGGASGQATGQGFLKGATQGALGQAVNQAVGDANLGGGRLQQGAQAGAQNFSNMLASGYDPKTAFMSGAATGLHSGLTAKPSESVIKSLDPYKVPTMAESTGATPIERAVADFTKTAVPAPALPAATAPSPIMGPLKLAGTALAVSSLFSGLNEAPQEVKAAVSTMSPEQQEYFARPSITWDWSKLQNDANAANLSLSQYMARNWNQVSSGAYNQPPPANTPVLKAMGGPLGQISRYARGSGSGRADTIDARLSDGEYVMDAETVAMLGDGSGEEGARRLDEMRSNLRQHKGRVMAKGKFSPDAKSPLMYIKRKGAR